MQPSGKRIYYLLKSYTDGTSTEAEEKELYEWAAGTPDSKEVKNHIKELIHGHEKDKFPEVDWERIYQQIWQNTHKGGTIHVVRKRYWLRAAAVILILILAGGGIYLSSVKKKQPVSVAENTTKPYKNDIKPGGMKAILKAGNSSVTLSKTDTNFTLAGNKVYINNGDVRIAKAKPVQYTLIIPHGGTYSLVLADGTKVWLNAESKLIYPSVFTGNTREVMLEGEAYFEVKTDAVHPFIVNSKNQRIEVLGTEFNVHAYPDENNIVTTLITGKVRINSSNKQLVLQSGQQAQLNKTGQLYLNPDVDIAQAIAWKKGYFRFDKADIYTIMKQLARWYDIKVSYSDNLPKRYFGAIMNRSNNISQILNMLEATGDVHFEVEGKEVRVMQ